MRGKVAIATFALILAGPWIFKTAIILWALLYAFMRTF
jgi:hypothetical protein